MSIKFNSRYDAYAYRIGWYDVEPKTVVEEGKFVKLNEKGRVVLAGEGEIGFLAIGSNREGRNQVKGKAINKIAFLHGAWSVWSDQVEGSVAPMDPLKVGTDGKLKKAELPTDAGKVVAYALQQNGGFTQIVSA